MLRRLRLTNFMSHRESEFALGPGLTVLIGPNNCGKSAIVEALRTLCENTPAEALVRHGAKTCQVTVETDDGHTITWQRVDGKVSYVIDGREIGRLGRGGLPDDLHELLRMPPVSPAGRDGRQDAINVHIGEQKSPLFLLDENGATIASFFSASSDAGRLLEMQQRHREKVREARKDRTRIAQELEALERRLAALVPLEELGPRVGELDRVWEDIRAADVTISALGGLADRIEELVRQQDYLARTIAALHPLAPPPPLEDEGALESVLLQLEATERRTKQLRARHEALADLRGPPGVEDEAHLEATGRALAGARHAVDQQQSRRDVLRELRPPPPLESVEPLEALVDGLAGGESQVAELARRERAAAAALAEATADIRGWAAAHPRCPLCGGPVVAETLLAGGHAHG